MTKINVFDYNVPQRKAISKCALTAEPRQNMPGVGQSTIDHLIALGIIEQDGKHRHDWPTYKLTSFGDEVHEALWKANRLL